MAMHTDRKVLYTVSLASLAILLVAFFIPDSSGRIVAALCLLPLAFVTHRFVKKRSVYSYHKWTVLLLLGVIALLFLTFYYLGGFYFGFYRTGYRLNVYYFFNFVLPIAAIIVCSEMMRSIFLAQNSRIADTLAYLICILGEVMICSGLSGIRSFAHFMDVVGLSLFPAVFANLLYHYLARRYGVYPNIVYRLVITLYTYIIPYKPAMQDSLYAFSSLLLPLAIYLFISALFEKKKRLALGKRGWLSTSVTVLALMLMTAFVMLISNEFYYGALVIATESMTGELNVGDAAIYEQYDGQNVIEGQVIAFENGKNVFVHRVVDIEYVDGVKRYYTKGDYNEDRDAGFITDDNIVGLVKLKVPLIGYPTLWIRSLFSR